MMLNKGRYGREQILSPATVGLRTSDHLTPAQREGADIFFNGYSSWGFGMAVAIQRKEIFQTPGRFGWDGGFGTSAYTDPREGMVGILFTQRLVQSPEPPDVYMDFWTLAYGAMDSASVLSAFGIQNRVTRPDRRTERLYRSRTPGS